jgi:hypothetical protein
MHRPFARIAGLAAVGALALAVAAPTFAAEPAPLKAVVAVDDGTPTAGSAWVRVLHGSPDAPEVDVYVGADLATAAKVDELSGLTFGEISAYKEVPAGTYGVKVCAAADPTICPIEVAALAIAADTKYTVAASDLLASIDANVFVDDAGAPDVEAAKVRVVHLSADTPAVDVLTQAGASIGIDGLTYPNRAPATGYASFPGGSYDLKVCASAPTAPTGTLCPIDPDALALENGKSYSVFAVGSLAATLPAATAAPDATAPATDTVGTTETAPAPSSLPFLLVLAAGTIAFVGGLRLATRRARR